MLSAPSQLHLCHAVCNNHPAGSKPLPQAFHHASTHALYSMKEMLEHGRRARQSLSDAPGP